MKSQTAIYELEMDGLNYNYGFRAIRVMLGRKEQDIQELQSKIAQAEQVARNTLSEHNDLAIADLIELYEYSCYQYAAHSMAAVGMIVPFVESFFRERFREFDIKLPSKCLVNNIIKSISEMGWGKYMPDDLEVTLTALFAYRNNMFHNGFEWPPKVRKSFARRLETPEWHSEWFSRASTGDDPWMFYMTDIFIDHCIDTIEKVAVGIEKLKREGISKHPN